MRVVVAAFIIIILGSLLLLMASEMPTFGDPDNPSNNQVSQRYSRDIIRDTNIPNVITGIITDYRAYDTLGEATVLFAGIAAVLTVLGSHVNAGRKRGQDDG